MTRRSIATLSGSPCASGTLAPRPHRRADTCAQTHTKQPPGVDNSLSGFDAEAEAYYGAIIARIKGWGKMVALNPGTTVRDCSFLQKQVRTAAGDAAPVHVDALPVQQL